MFEKTASEVVNYRVETMLEDIREIRNAEPRMKALDKLLRTLPKKIQNRCTVSLYGHGSYISADIRPKWKFTDHDTILITQWCAEQEKFEFSKDVSSYDGDMSLELYRRVWSRHYDRRASYTIKFHATANVDGCKLVEKVVTREVKTYEIQC